ncbi:MAG: hypothetical protein LBJ93_02800 [Clostridiales bacterium]|nr:hypothetical protein [Clostridiales bacterium]
MFKKNLQSDKQIVIKFENTNLTSIQQNKLLDLMSKEIKTKIKLFQKELIDQNKINQNKEFAIESKSFTHIRKISLRCGQSINHTGSVVVIGDVNSGSEIFATENIIVMGKVSGLLHAGCLGNESSFISASKYLPVQIRIANYFFRLGEEINNPIFIDIKNNSIVIDSLKYKTNDREKTNI